MTNEGRPEHLPELRVLLVDDEHGILEAYSRMLASAGCSVKGYLFGLPERGFMAPRWQ